MKILINLCESYAAEWKIEFNALKSIAYSNGTNCKPLFSLNNSEIPHKYSFIYLGLPVGEVEKSNERSFFFQLKKI